MRRLFQIVAAPIVAATAVLAITSPALAQLSQKSDAPVDITADELEVINSKCEAIWRGNAEALQDTARLRANVLRIFNTPGPAKPGTTGASCGAVERMEAEGSVYYVTPTQRIRSNSAVYLSGSAQLTMIGDVVAAQGQNVIRGDRMVVNTNTGEAQMKGSSTGRNKQSRPRGVFYPSKKAEAPAPQR